jgi:hypothetical protein
LPTFAPNQSIAPLSTASSTATTALTGPGGCAVTPTPYLPGAYGIACFTITGSDQVSGGFESAFFGASSCSDLAHNGQSASGAAKSVFQPPNPSSGNHKFGGMQVSLEFNIGPYTGPGSYPTSSLIQIANVGTNEYSINTHPGNLSAQVNPDGSGSLTATNLTTNDGSKTVTVKEQWTCKVSSG